MAEGDSYTPTQAAKILRITSHRVRQMLNNGELEGVQDGSGHWQIPARAVHERLSERPPRERTTSTDSSGDLRTGERVAELEAELSRLQREMGRMEGRLELTERTESTLREERDRLLEDLEREREDHRQQREQVERLRDELEEARKPWWRRLFS